MIRKSFLFVWRAVRWVCFRALCLLLHAYSKLRRRRVIVYYKHRDFARKSEAFADLLRKRGFPTVLHSGMSFSTRALLKTSADLWIGFWNEVPLPFLPKNYIFLNAEPLHVKRWSDNTDWFQAMRNSKQVWGYTKSNKDYVEKLGVSFQFVPFGYAPYYETSFQKHNKGKKFQQDIDVLFFGDISERRGRVLDELRRRGMNVHVVSRAKETYGEQLDELIARSKIVLAIYYYDEPQAQIIDLARTDHLLSNGLFVLHEQPSVSAPAFEENVTICEYVDIPDTCAYFLARPEDRARKASKAREWFKSEYALDAFIPYRDVQRLLRSE